MATQPRTQERKDFTEGVRLALAEKDLDEHDAAFDRFANELAKIKGILIGILVSVTTACILMVVNLGVK